MSIQKTNRRPVILVRLREAMRAYTQRTGERMTYELLSARTGLSRATVESIGTRGGYNATLNAIARICAALECTPGALLDLEAPRAKPRTRGAK